MIASLFRMKPRPLLQSWRPHESILVPHHLRQQPSCRQRAPTVHLAPAPVRVLVQALAVAPQRSVPPSPGAPDSARTPNKRAMIKSALNCSLNLIILYLWHHSGVGGRGREVRNCNALGTNVAPNQILIQYNTTGWHLEQGSVNKT